MTQKIDGLRLAERAGLHLTGLLSIVACVVTMHWAIMRPANEERTANLARIGELTRVVASESTVQKEHQRLKTEQTLLHAQINDLKVRLPSEADVNKLLSELADLAERTSVKILAVQPLDSQVEDVAAFQKIRCRILADYQNGCQFVAGLDQIQSVVWTMAAEIAVDSTSKRLQPMELELALFFAPEHTEVGTISIGEKTPSEKEST